MIPAKIDSIIGLLRLALRWELLDEYFASSARELIEDNKDCVDCLSLSQELEYIYKKRIHIFENQGAITFLVDRLLREKNF